MLVFRNPLSRLRFACISYDFARQVSLPMMYDLAVNAFFADKNVYDVKSFGTIDEALFENVWEYRYVYGKVIIMGQFLWSQCYISYLTEHTLRKSYIFTYPHRLLCGSKQNNYCPHRTTALLGYCMTRLGLMWHNSADWHLMTVGLTKLMPDEELGNSRRYVGLRVHLFWMEESVEAIIESSKSNIWVGFSVLVCWLQV